MSVTTNTPGSSTCRASSTDCVLATSTPRRRVSCDCARYRPVKTFSPPMPRRMRRPETVSAPSVVRRPDASRWAAWRRLQRLDEQAEDRGDRRQAEDDDEPERDRHAQHEDRDDAVRDEAAEEVGGEREDLADAQRVVGDGRDDLTGRQLLGDRVARPRDGAADQLRGRERGAQPVVDVVPVADGRRRDDRPRRAPAGCRTRATGPDRSRCSRPSSIARPTTYGVNAWAGELQDAEHDGDEEDAPLPPRPATRAAPWDRSAAGCRGRARGRERTRSNVTGRY